MEKAETELENFSTFCTIKFEELVEIYKYKFSCS